MSLSILIVSILAIVFVVWYYFEQNRTQKEPKQNLPMVVAAPQVPAPTQSPVQIPNESIIPPSNLPVEDQDTFKEINN